MCDSSSPLKIIPAISSSGVGDSGSRIVGDVGIVILSLASLMTEDRMSPPCLQPATTCLENSFQSIHECVSLLVVTAVEDAA
jgi:hypothetical protein